MQKGGKQEGGKEVKHVSYPTACRVSRVLHMYRYVARSSIQAGSVWVLMHAQCCKNVRCRQVTANSGSNIHA